MFGNSKNYVAMIEKKSGDYVSIDLKLPPENKVEYLGDFSGGVADYIDGDAKNKKVYEVESGFFPNEVVLLSSCGEKAFLRIYGSEPVKLSEKNQVEFYHESTPHKVVMLEVSVLKI